MSRNPASSRGVWAGTRSPQSFAGAGEGFVCVCENSFERSPAPGRDLALTSSELAKHLALSFAALVGLHVQENRGCPALLGDHQGLLGISNSSHDACGILA